MAKSIGISNNQQRWVLDYIDAYKRAKYARNNRFPSCFPVRHEVFPGVKQTGHDKEGF